METIVWVGDFSRPQDRVLSVVSVSVLFRIAMSLPAGEYLLLRHLMLYHITFVRGLGDVLKSASRAGVFHLAVFVVNAETVGVLVEVNIASPRLHCDQERFFVVSRYLSMWLMMEMTSRSTKGVDCRVTLEILVASWWRSVFQGEAPARAVMSPTLPATGQASLPRAAARTQS